MSGLNQEEIENLNKLISSKNKEKIIKYLPKNKSPDSDGFSNKFYQNIKEEIVGPERVDMALTFYAEMAFIMSVLHLYLKETL